VVTAVAVSQGLEAALQLVQVRELTLAGTVAQVLQVVVEEALSTQRVLASVAMAVTGLIFLLARYLQVGLELLEQVQTVAAEAEQVSQVMAQTQLEQLAVLVDLAGAGAVLVPCKGSAEQEFSTFSTRRHYDL
jgi:hypothetical protein